MQTRMFLIGLILLAGLGYFALEHSTRAASRVLPFQGQLKDGQGNPLPDGAKVVQFKIYDAPVGGQAVWNGEVQKLSINGGLVSTLLGTKANLAAVDFNRDLYLELTIDANNDTQITAADPPLLPRHSILPTVFAIEAADSRLLGGYSWNDLLGSGNPQSGIPGSRIHPQSITGSQIANQSLTGSHIANQSLTGSQLVPQTITSNQIALNSISSDRIVERSITFDRLSPRPIGSSVQGGIAVSPIVEDHTTSVEGPVPGLTVDVAYTGRPVILQLIGGNETASRVTLRKGTGDGVNLLIALFRNGEEIARQSMSTDQTSVGGWAVPSSSFRFIDLQPTAGRQVNTYSIFVRLQGGGASAGLYNVRLVGYEL